MHRTWLVLLAVCCIVLAGCSAPGQTPTTTDASGDGGDFSYPAGWSSSGLDNATLAIQRADEAVAGSDFAERLVSVRSTTISGETKYVVDVLEVQIDYENERLLTDRQFFVVSNQTARQVVDSGTGALGDRKPGEVRRLYLNSSGGVEYYRLGNRSPNVSRLQSGDFPSAIDRRLPGQLVNAFPLLENASYTGAEANRSAVTYSIEGVEHAPFQNGSGHVTVRSDGLVVEFTISQSGSSNLVSYAYEVDRRDQTVEPPGWTTSNG